MEVRARRREHEALRRVEEKAVRLAVIAHVRHVETRYDELLARGYACAEARAQVEETIERVLEPWQVREGEA